MYHDYYQLKGNPFDVTADPDFFYASKWHSEAMSNLMYGIDQRKGIIVITGEIGSGKTILCRRLLKQADSATKFVLILNPDFSELELLQMIVRDFGLKARQKDKYALIQVLNQFLLKETGNGHTVVLVIDEAQNLTADQFEKIRLLSNLETEKEKLLQIVLIGQMELYDKLLSPELRQLRQRIAVYFHMWPLEKNDVRSYIYHRITRVMRSPDALNNIIFTEGAVDKIFRYTQGSPRAVNLLCDRALLAGCVADTTSIDEAIIEECAKEVLDCEHYIRSIAKDPA